MLNKYGQPPNEACFCHASNYVMYISHCFLRDLKVIDNYGHSSQLYTSHLGYHSDSVGFSFLMNGETGCSSPFGNHSNWLKGKSQFPQEALLISLNDITSLKGKFSTGAMTTNQCHVTINIGQKVTLNDSMVPKRSIHPIRKKLQKSKAKIKNAIF